MGVHHPVGEAGLLSGEGAKVTVKKTMKVTDAGRLLCIFVNEAPVKKRVVEEPQLDLLGITKSIASVSLARYVSYLDGCGHCPRV